MAPLLVSLASHLRPCPCMLHQQMARPCRPLAFPGVWQSGRHSIADTRLSDGAPIIPMDGSTAAYLSACLTLIVVATVVPSCVSVGTADPVTYPHSGAPAR